MRRRTAIIGLFATVVLLLLVAGLAHRAKLANHAGASHDASGEPHLLGVALVHQGNGPNAVFAASLTNEYDVPICLRGHAIQYEDERGQVLSGPRGWGTWHPWTGLTNFDQLLPYSVAGISFRAADVPAQAKRVRLVFQYFYDAGPAVKAIGAVVTNLPVRKLWPEVRYQLYQRGLLNGQHQRSYDGGWVSIPQGGANGRQPVGAEANSTSATAASRRSP